ncbi:MAG: glycosyltransferase [Paracoccus sp. (in: a-proteobacteria)]|nr:glycosyltransferase [Paracoccus sp. (in: a-proteobacteria)]
MAARLSIVVVSRGRPGWLAQCLAALALQDHPSFEIVLVSDPEGLAVRPDLPLKRAAFDEPNISQARNRGIAEASGEIIAFIDDDAVAEPVWARRLCAPFEDPKVIAATGWTHGPDGLSFQAQSQRLQADGRAAELPPHPETQHLPPEGGLPVSTIGTNCAFRSEALREVGGFDPAFAYHLDESDLNMRMAAAWPEALTAIVPGARVMHGLAANDSRAAAQTPVDLTMLGRSASIFLARYNGGQGGAALMAAQRARLLRHMVAGRLDPLRVAPLLSSLADGLRGDDNPAQAPAPRRFAPPPDFLPMPSPRRDFVFLTGWHWQAKTLRRKAAHAARSGKIVSILLLTPTFLPHRMQFTKGGWFEQKGGLWGASLASDGPVVLMRRHARIARERENILFRRA